jgi:hypothetical protein
MRKYFDVVFYTTSIPAADAKVFVFDVDGNLAPLYAEDGTTPVTNPVTTDSTGFYSFFINNGTYTLQYTHGPDTLRILTNVQIFDESGIIPDEFAAAILLWFNSIPKTLPAQPGVLWNNGGSLAQS